MMLVAEKPTEISLNRLSIIWEFISHIYCANKEKLYTLWKGTANKRPLSETVPLLVKRTLRLPLTGGKGLPLYWSYETITKPAIMNP